MKPNAFESHAAAISDLGFLLRRDLPTDGEDATLVLALRATPTLRHFDPELVTYWRADDRGRGHRGELSFETPMPLHVSFSWGTIEVVDRFGIANTFVTVGGTMDVRRVDARTVVGVLRSPGPILRRGGHSQSYDQFASELIAFFARMMVPIDFVDGAEGRISDADPAVRYAMFLQHELARLSASELVRSTYAIDARLVRAEARRLAARRPAAWAEGRRLLELLGLVREARTALPASATG
jgi:hypothetical protein